MLTTKTSQLQGPSNGLFPCLCAPAVQQFFLNASPCFCCCRWHLLLAQRGDSPPQQSDRLHTTETAKENRANVVFLISGGQELRQQRHFSRTAAPLGSLPCKIFSGGTQNLIPAAKAFFSYQGDKSSCTWPDPSSLLPGIWSLADERSEVAEEAKAGVFPHLTSPSATYHPSPWLPEHQKPSACLSLERAPKWAQENQEPNVVEILWSSLSSE